MPLAYANGAAGDLPGLLLSARGAVVVLAMALVAPLLAWAAARWQRRAMA